MHEGYGVYTGAQVREYQSPWADSASGTRLLALSIPAFRQGVSVIAGTCGSVPLRVTKGRDVVPTPQLLAQPDPDEPASVTWSRVYEDLVLFPHAWLQVTARNGAGYPTSAIYHPYEEVSVDDRTGAVIVDGDQLPPRDVVRFDSPFAPGALTDGLRILTTSLLVEEAVRRFASFDLPSGALRQTGGPTLSDGDVDDLLGAWETARQNRATAFLNPNVDYAPLSWSAEQLQLRAARDANAQDIARLLNLPPVYVNADTASSLTYATTESQGRQLLNTTLIPYLTAVTGRLSMPDLTPRGHVVEASFDVFLRADLVARSQAYGSLLAAGVLTVDEARALEGLPPLAQEVAQ